MVSFAEIALGVPLVIGVGTWIISSAANRINKGNADRQIAVAERSIYLNLVEKRSQWLEDFRQALWDRDGELMFEATEIAEGQTPLVTDKRRRLHLLTTRARWLFDEPTKYAVDAVSDALDKKLETLVSLRAFLLEGDGEKPKARREAHFAAVTRLNTCIEAVEDRMPAFMYVGDIKRKPEPGPPLGRKWKKLPLRFR